MFNFTQKTVTEKMIDAEYKYRLDYELERWLLLKVYDDGSWLLVEFPERKLDKVDAKNLRVRLVTPLDQTNWEDTPINFQAKIDK